MRSHRGQRTHEHDNTTTVIMLSIFLIIALGIYCYFKRSKNKNTEIADDTYKGVGGKSKSEQKVKRGILIEKQQYAQQYDEAIGSNSRSRTPSPLGYNDGIMKSNS